VIGLTEEKDLMAFSQTGQKEDSRNSECAAHFFFFFS
jgi:hypothetical protein